MTKTYVADARLTDIAHGGAALPEEIIGIADELRLRRGAPEPAAEIERLRAAMTGLLQSLESDVHGMIDARAAEARAALAGSPAEPKAGKTLATSAQVVSEKSPVQTLECPVCRTVHDLPLCPESSD